MSSLLPYTQVLLAVCFSIVCANATTSGSSQSDKKLPNIVFLLIDDFGWADASWHREKGYREVQTPHMQELVESGIELDRNYVYKFCSPTRSSIQSGRNPIHVNAQNVDMMSFDPSNPLTGISGIPVNMTGFAQRMAEAGYNHRIFAGKADFGMAHHKQTPMGRGYTDALFYFNHMNDYWSQNVGKCGSLWMRDLFGTNADGSSGPQHHLLNPEHCWVQNMSAHPEVATPAFPKNMSGCVYEEDLFTDFTVKHIMEHNPKSGPLLAFHSAHSIHTPLEIVPDAYEKFAFIEWEDRRRYHAMVWNVDRAVGRIVDALKTKGLYENTLIVLSADNGGPIYMKGGGGGNNFPLKGGKAGNWEGGVRVNGFVSGGFVPEAMRGKKLPGLVTGWDWYATFVHGIAGLDATDAEAAGAGLPPIDSIDQWAYLSGATDIPPRTEVPMGTTGNPKDIWASQNDIEVHALIKQDPHDKSKLWKLIVGQEPQAIWTGPMFPNATTKQLPGSETVFEDCGLEVGCLFDITSDPTEHTNVAAENPEVVQALRRSLSAHNATVFAPARPNANAKACAAALSLYKDPRYAFGWWGPFADRMTEVVV